MFKQRLKDAVILRFWGRGFQMEGPASCKGPEVGQVKNRKKAIVPRANKLH
jgi:hypothetical protein